jgi:hypothetical protein
LIVRRPIVPDTRTRAEKRFSLVTPCTQCPFRTDVPVFLRPERAQGIAESLLRGETFPCHKTVDYDVEYDEEPNVQDSKVCAGATILLDREGRSMQEVRIAERLNLCDPSQMRTEDAPVYDSLGSWVAAHRPSAPTVTTSDGEVLEFEHCDVVGPECEDPAGYGFGGGAVENMDEPTCNPLTDTCNACGSLVCGSCWSEDEDHVCVSCAGDENEGEETE